GGKDSGKGRRGVCGQIRADVVWLWHAQARREAARLRIDPVSETKTYDFVIIGGGPAGILSAATSKQAGKSGALVDAERGLGGAGVNTGTVPSKTLRETALAIAGTKARNLLGVNLTLKQEATVSEFFRHEQHVKSGFNTMISQQLRTDKAELYW